MDYCPISTILKGMVVEQDDIAAQKICMLVVAKVGSILSTLHESQIMLKTGQGNLYPPTDILLAAVSPTPTFGQV